MAAFFANQLDFILFFYGLAFILLGAVCVAVARGTRTSIPWKVLGAFAYLHGAGEWLDLLALVAGDTAAFAVGRLAVMTASFILLCEFARIEALRLNFPAPGRWIYVPALLLVAFGWHLAGLNGANVLARYTLGFTGAMATAAVLGLYAKKIAPEERRWMICAAAGIGLYGIATGLVVPPTPSWGGDVVNYDHFIGLTGVPIQLVRGLLACFVAFSVWAYWGQRLIVHVASARYEKFQHRQFFWTLAAMGAILVFGWVLTDYLGGIYKSNVEKETAGDLNVIASRLSSETSAIRGSVTTLAATRSIAALAAHDGSEDARAATADLKLQADAAGADDAFILDATGKVIAATGTARGGDAQVFDAERYLRQAPGGSPVIHGVIDGPSRAAKLVAAQQIVRAGAQVVGVAVLIKPLSSFAADVQSFDRPFALIDRNGVVLLTNRPEMHFRTLWPLALDRQLALSKLYGPLSDQPALREELVHSAWTTFDGERDYVQRTPVLSNDWSLVMWMATDGISASRVLGIIITLQMTLLALVYLIGKERWIHDNVQLERRLELEERARSLDARATTDPLTGLYNRRKFDRSMATEILRAHRYGTPLSLILYDIDHFKTINDTGGHQAGDNVLIKLSRFVAARIRDSDVQARWGGEEFVILCPGSTGPMACQLAGNLRDAIRTLTFGSAGTVTCSFGVAQYVEGDTPESLLARADDALYRAKMNGRDRVEQAAAPPYSATQTHQSVA